MAWKGTIYSFSFVIYFFLMIKWHLSFCLLVLAPFSYSLSFLVMQYDFTFLIYSLKLVPFSIVGGSGILFFQKKLYLYCMLRERALICFIFHDTFNIFTSFILNENKILG